MLLNKLLRIKLEKNDLKIKEIKSKINGCDKFMASYLEKGNITKVNEWLNMKQDLIKELESMDTSYPHNQVELNKLLLDILLDNWFISESGEIVNESEIMYEPELEAHILFDDSRDVYGENTIIETYTKLELPSELLNMIPTLRGNA